MTLISAGETRADIRAEQVLLNEQGISGLLKTPWGAVNLHSPLVGGFNLTNLML